MVTPKSSISTHQVTQVDGLEVIAREPAVGQHPRYPDRPAFFAGVEKVLLSDGTERHICLGAEGQPCTFVSDSTRSVVAHRNGTHNLREPRRPTMYTDEILRRVVREVEKAKRAGVRGYCEAAASALNEAGVQTVHGEPWSPGSVSHLYSNHRSLVRVRTPPATGRPKVDRAKAKRAHRPPPMVAQELPTDLDVLRDRLRTWANDLVTVQAAILTILDNPVQVADMEMAEKARRYDELQNLLGK